MINQIPAGYRLNAKGDLVNVDNIKPVDLLRDELVNNLLEKAKRIAPQIAELKQVAFAEIEAFIEQSVSEYGVHYRGNKGNNQFISFDGKYKIERAVQDRIAFDERLEAAKALIDECLNDWCVGANINIATIVKDAFQVDKKGNIRVASVLSLRKHRVDNDERWTRAMEAISDAVQVLYSKAYIRFYERDDNGVYRLIPLDIAGV